MRIKTQTLRDEVSRQRMWVESIGKTEFSGFYVSISDIHVVAFEGSPAYKQSVADNSDSPGVDLLAVWEFLEHFGSEVVWRSTK